MKLHVKRATQEKNLAICRAIARFFQQHPATKNLLSTFAWQNVGMSSKFSNCSGGGVGTANAHCHISCETCPVARICIKQRLLAAPFGFSTRGQIRYSAPKKIVGAVYSARIPFVQKNPLLKKYRRYEAWIAGGVPLSGPWALVDVMCHELAHHTGTISGKPGDLLDSSSHGPKFYGCYLKLHDVIVAAIKSRDPNLPPELISAIWRRF